MSLEPKIISKIIKRENHEEVLQSFINLYSFEADPLDLIVNCLYEFEVVRQKLLQDYTVSFLDDPTKGVFIYHTGETNERLDYKTFVSLIRNINIIRCLCRQDLIKLDLELEIDIDYNLIITKGDTVHRNNKTFITHDGYKYTIKDSDESLAYFVNLIQCPTDAVIDSLIADKKGDIYMSREKV